MEKNSQKGSFRSVRTSGDVENCFGVEISTSDESTADVCKRCRRASTHINGLDRHSTTLALTLIYLILLILRRSIHIIMVN